ncbi:MAG: HTH-type transcriptional regulator GltR [Paracidovorax wautersii]|uniref:HTH-type transcriptional regulator GltR n=1 Tax=Paracidovorax wautersii TaxID=1177982 RepID=A0A7V8FL35_9BURK|nr:MAG: HTH-type transcriptional regulator GltR [Paracidovorax wautersii]
MDLESLRIFRSVAAELSVTHAATRLGRAPSNVSTRIQQLEADLGVDLFVRSGKRMALSTAGERFLDYAQRFLALETEARHVVTGGQDGGMLRIGSMESTAASRLPALLVPYHSAHPTTRLELSTGASRQLIERVRKGQLDCAFAALPPSLTEPAALDELGLCTAHGWTEDLVLLLPVGDAKAKRISDVRTRSFAGFPQGCTYRSLAEDLLGAGGSTEWSVQEMNSYHAMIACVAAGASVTLLPQSVLALTRLPAGLGTLKVGRSDTVLLWRAGYDTPAFGHLRAHLKGAQQGAPQ